jgi:Zn finger protein HypA/HybF involved in hydrogenase expression
MHEHALAQQILKLLENKKVKKITIRVGQLSHHTPEGVEQVLKGYLKNKEIKLEFKTPMDDKVMIESYET